MTYGFRIKTTNHAGREFVSPVQYGRSGAVKKAQRIENELVDRICSLYQHGRTAEAERTAALAPQRIEVVDSDGLTVEIVRA